MQTECRILLGEDDLITAKSIKVFLEKKGLKIINIAESGEDLIKKALYDYPSMIITDITLKGQLDGIEAISRISEIVKVPYIFVTGFREYISVITSYNLNPLKTFIKPIDFNVLYKVIKEIFLPSLTLPSYYLG
jgi:DNA-binding NarL/FixJ family response regulator